MDWLLVASTLYLVGGTAFLVCSVRAGRLRDPRDADGRRRPRAEDADERADRLVRIGQVVHASCIGLALVVGVVARPESLPFVGGAAAIGLLIVLVVRVVRRRRRAHRAAALDADAA